MTYIRDDPVTWAADTSAAMIIIYLSTLHPELMPVLLFAGFLLVAGITLTSRVVKRGRDDPRISGEEMYDIGSWTLVTLVGIGVGAIIGVRLYDYRRLVSVFGLQIIQLNTVNRRLLGALMAVVEERFFRGFLLNFLLQKFDQPLPVVLSGLVGGLYHLGVYGGSPGSLLFTVLAFTVLSWVAWKAKRLSVPYIAHLVNNVILVG